MRYMLAIVLVLVSLFLLWEFVPLACSVWIGHFVLSTTIEGPHVESIRSVQCVPCMTVTEADYIVAHWPYREMMTSGTTTSSFDGHSIEVPVTVTGRISPMGRQISRRQPQYLAVLATLESGEQLGKIVEIPDGRVSPSVTVELP